MLPRSRPRRGRTSPAPLRVTSAAVWTRLFQLSQPGRDRTCSHAQPSPAALAALLLAGCGITGGLSAATPATSAFGEPRVDLAEAPRGSASRSVRRRSPSRGSSVDDEDPEAERDPGRTCAPCASMSYDGIPRRRKRPTQRLRAIAVPAPRRRLDRTVDHRARGRRANGRRCCAARHA